ncbi:hypothetical protein [Caldivirga maquilingensis]|uniref:Twin-arginine translocation signal domain-containing protein n=1 Tax=Caldivirga maquilingensis (strain ATCC 700844 / DSM 13496 / JCM 10307 / IC-167) TaxID=397948 RepID=A8MAP5_CALMQ|nr:hypothetical protein [Caldivirga maquilingensis]ABW01081.1 hypothetical protein Cmaq_0233 [Caldivirga maquilingensis IC-167]
MDRRRFLKILGAAAGAGGLVYAGLRAVNSINHTQEGASVSDFIEAWGRYRIIVYEKNGYYYAIDWHGLRICVNSNTACIQEALNYIGNDCLSRGGNCRVSLLIKPGTYEVNESIDFREAFPPYASYYNYLNVVSEPGSIIQPSPYFPTRRNSALVILSPSSGSQIYFSRINLPYINASMYAVNNINGLVMSQVNDSVIDIPGVSYSSNIGVLINEGGNPNEYPNISGLPAAGFFNNLITIGLLTFNKVGLATIGNNETPLGVQANTFFIQHIYGNNVGIILDMTGSMPNGGSMWNQIMINVIEHNSNLGILDNSGGNIFRINNANTNPPNSDYVESSNVILGSYVIGYLSDGYTLRRGLSKVINLWG